MKIHHIFCFSTWKTYLSDKILINEEKTMHSTCLTEEKALFLNNEFQKAPGSIFFVTIFFMFLKLDDVQPF